MGSYTSNRTSVLTRPSDTTAYAINDLIASSVTAGSIVVPPVVFYRDQYNRAGGMIVRLRIVSNHTTGLSGVAVVVRVWAAAPTFTNGDNGAYAVATGAANYLGKFAGTFEQFADGAVAELVPSVGSVVGVVGAVAGSIYWDLQTSTAFTPQSGKTFTLTAEVDQD